MLIFADFNLIVICANPRYPRDQRSIKSLENDHELNFLDTIYPIT